MQCVICHSDEIEKKQVQEEFHLNDDIVRIPVEALVCRNCGERFYDRRTVRYLEDLEKRLQANEIPLRQTGKVMVREDA